MEFLVDKDGNYYFIEMNTRIQVEHAVTEEVTGIDLVKQQILIASGQPLKIDQKEVQINGHAIEARICAEDPTRNFAPSPGEINLYYSPGGFGVRIDSHIYGGYIIPPYYDSMIAKVITRGNDRKEAIARMDRSLKEFLVRGIRTNTDFVRSVIRDPVFVSGQATTKFIEEFLSRSAATGIKG